MASSQGKKYVLVEWECDSSVSVVPTSRLKTRDGMDVTQVWPGGVFAGSVLEESDSKMELNARAKELVKEATKSPEKKSPQKKTPKRKSPRKNGKRAQKNEKSPAVKTKRKPSEKAQKRLADIERAQKEAEWLFGDTTCSASDEDSGSDGQSSSEEEYSRRSQKRPRSSSQHHEPQPNKYLATSQQRSLSPLLPTASLEVGRRDRDKSAASLEVGRQDRDKSAASLEVGQQDWNTPAGRSRSSHTHSSRHDSDTSARSSYGSGRDWDMSAGKSRSSHGSGRDWDMPAGNSRSSHGSGRDWDMPAGNSRSSYGSGRDWDMPAGNSRSSYGSGRDWDMPAGNSRSSRGSGRDSGNTRSSHGSVRDSDMPAGNSRSSHGSGRESFSPFSPTGSSHVHSSRRDLGRCFLPLSPIGSLRSRSSSQQDLNRSVSPAESFDLDRSLSPANSSASHGRSKFKRSFSPSSSVASGEFSMHGDQGHVRVEKPRLVELVEGLGVYVPAHKLLMAIRASKKSPSAMLRQLMGVLFTEEEMARCSVRGKGSRPSLPEQQMEAALGYVLSKYPNERVEYLVRQANDKCNRVRARSVSNQC